MANQQPKNVFEQIVFGLKTVNDNIVDLYKQVSEIHDVLYPKELNNTSEPNTPGDDKNNMSSREY